MNEHLKEAGFQLEGQPWEYKNKNYKKSTAKNIIENLENQIGVQNAFGSKDLASQELYDAIEHEPRTVTIIDKDGNTTIRPITQEEESDFESDFMQELEADHADE